MAASSFFGGGSAASGNDAKTGHVRVYKSNDQDDRWDMQGSEIWGAKKGEEKAEPLQIAFAAKAKLTGLADDQMIMQG